MTYCHKVSMLVYPGIQILDVTGPLEVFSRTSRWLHDHHQQYECDAYSIELIAARPGPVRSSSGIKLLAHRAFSDVKEADTLLVAGGIGYREALEDKAMIDWLRNMQGQTKRLGSVCTGAMLLAHAGLLNNHRVTTHWAYMRQLEEAGSNIELDDDSIYVFDKGIYTSAGVTAGMDMALAMVAQDWDEQVALAVARELVLFLKRPGGQAQFSRHLQAQQAESDRLRRLQLWILEHLDQRLTVSDLACEVAMSPRNFARHFADELGQTPAAYVAQARVEAARHRLETTTLPIAKVASLCGFGTAETMRRAFARNLGVSPREYRERFSAFPRQPRSAR